VFEKKNANTLPKHQPYGCVIDLVGMQPPFEPKVKAHYNGILGANKCNVYWSCHYPSLGLATKAKAYKNVSQE